MEINLSDNAKYIFHSSPGYCKEGETIENTLFRVSKEFGNTEEEIQECYNLLYNGYFRPNTPVFFNAGKHIDDKIFSACFIADINDSMDSIYDIANVARKVFQFGSGIGIPIGNLREHGAPIFSKNDKTKPEGMASGPVSFAQLYDTIGFITKSGGKTRRAAILLTMLINHPDILKFITAKEDNSSLSNMNISVSITDKYMESLRDHTNINYVSPTGKVLNEIDPYIIWNELVDMAWKTADPGVVFIDTINKHNIIKKLEYITALNPCGEIPSPPWHCCNLAHLNLEKFIKFDSVNNLYYFDFNELRIIAKKVFRLMDNLIDKMSFPDDRFKDKALKFRDIGLGTMSLADALFKLDIKYDSIEGRKFAEEVEKIVTCASIEESAFLAKEKGKFYKYDICADDAIEEVKFLSGNDTYLVNLVKENGLRNSNFTCIAPCGTTAISCDCSYGMEPCFGLVYQKSIIDGKTLYVVNKIFKERFEKEEWYNADLLDKIAKNNGSLKNIRGIPKEVKDIFVVAHDIKWKDRIDMQAVLTKKVSLAISSTLNLPNNCPKEEISEIFKYAYEKGLKGITVYRDGCKQNQPITFGKKEKEKINDQTNIRVKRPTRLSGETCKVETGSGDLLLTVNKLNDTPIEIIANVGKSGKDLFSLTEALGRAVSIGLQHNPALLPEYIKQFAGINSDKPVWIRLEETDERPIQILSIPDAISKILDRYYLTGKTKIKIIEKSMIDESISYTLDIKPEENYNEICEKCGAKSMIKIEGCSSCKSCGFSKCS